MIQTNKQNQKVVVNVHMPADTRKKHRRRTRKPSSKYEQAVQALEIARLRRWNHNSFHMTPAPVGVPSNPEVMSTPISPVKSYDAPPSRIGPNYSPRTPEKTPPSLRDLNGRRVDVNTPFSPVLSSEKSMTPIPVAFGGLTPQERTDLEERDNSIQRQRETLPPRPRMSAQQRAQIEGASLLGFRSPGTHAQYGLAGRTRSGLQRGAQQPNVEGQGVIPRMAAVGPNRTVHRLAQVIEEQNPQPVFPM